MYFDTDSFTVVTRNVQHDQRLIQLNLKLILVSNVKANKNKISSRSLKFQELKH